MNQRLIAAEVESAAFADTAARTVADDALSHSDGAADAQTAAQTPDVQDPEAHILASRTDKDHVEAAHTAAC